ncbi:TadE/TadG family type IV pilus assembly protein [Knoellia koreensis]|uniref:Pilus assembly protein n=1 Tax=Knoellia koreensis TaxID=2730921 RepID=A0A849H969_9MICO|nr:TadE family protein [Knoellia sp. DB2414S]NNM46286.1 pilus assembly protein [Knoellia sp. DB2414S]
MVRRRETGAAVVDFVLVGSMLTFLFLGIVQLGLALHVRNTLIASASEGARFGARADVDPAIGAERARSLIASSLSDRFARDVSVSVEDADGVQVVVVRVRAPLPVIGLVGPGDGFDVVGRAFEERQ